MKVEVTTAIEELKQQFSGSPIVAREDGQGGAYVIIDGVSLGSKYQPPSTWLGFQIPAQYPYADIYPVFMGANVTRVNGGGFTPPVTAGHNFEGRPALQISRKLGSAQNGLQKAKAKILKILAFLEKWT